VKLQIKICGITREIDAALCCEAGADTLGFIFHPKSPRAVTPETAAVIIASLPPSITSVGVFVNEKRSVINEIVRRTGIRILQFSGDESAEECSGYSIDVWKAFRIREAKDVRTTREYSVAAALLDGAPDGVYGGSGMPPDFSIARELARYHRVIIAGGLNPENILDAIRTARPAGIDVNSGIESSPGKKDPEKIKALFGQIARLLI
jgi:phosphoribosylanthranilate isomerase